MTDTMPSMIEVNDHAAEHWFRAIQTEIGTFMVWITPDGADVSFGDFAYGRESWEDYDEQLGETQGDINLFAALVVDRLLRREGLASAD